MIGPHRLVYVDGSVYPPAFLCFVQKTNEDGVVVVMRSASRIKSRSKRGVERWVPDFTASEEHEVLSVSGLEVCTETGTRVEIN